LIVRDLQNEFIVGIEDAVRGSGGQHCCHRIEIFTGLQASHAVRKRSRKLPCPGAALQFSSSRAVGNLELPASLRPPDAAPQRHPEHSQTSARCVEIRILKAAYFLIKTAAIRHQICNRR
jgi:hypothetical protein